MHGGRRVGERRCRREMEVTVEKSGSRSAVVCYVLKTWTNTKANVVSYKLRWFKGVTENNALFFKTVFIFPLKALMQVYNSVCQAVISQSRATGASDTIFYIFLPLLPSQKLYRVFMATETLLRTLLGSKPMINCSAVSPAYLRYCDSWCVTNHFTVDCMAYL